MVGRLLIALLAAVLCSLAAAPLAAAKPGGIAIGLDGWRYAGHPASATAAQAQLAPLLFPIDNDPFADRHAGRERESGAPWMVLLAGLAALGLLLASGRAITVRRAVA
jgi:hypothetical protein